MKYYPLLILFYLLVHPTLSSKPNVVVFLVDDLGYMDIGANNPDCFYDTPHIDKLAATAAHPWSRPPNNNPNP